MPKGTPRRGSVDLGARAQRRGSVDLGADRKKKRGLNRTMTAIGMAAPEDAKSSMSEPEPAPAGDQVRPGAFHFSSILLGGLFLPHQLIASL